MAKKPMKPGTSVPVSGIYKEVVAGEKFPPTTHKGNGYVLDRATKRKPLPGKEGDKK